MAINGRIKVEFGEVFPQGLYVWEHTRIEPARDFDKSTRDKPVQAADRDSGLPLWTLDALDPDEMARGKQNAVTVRIAAEYCPTLPDATVGPVRPIELEQLSVTAYVDQPPNGRPRVAWSYRATGIKAPGKPGAGVINDPGAGSPASSSGSTSGSAGSKKAA